ncbi:transmembrane protein 199-like [Actinia tenebrosa]|uniref:Transmembrane protein 199-like n=1 Tax=Actinia tenebrosa TaxID=6105 RepID=A0A6P8IVX2_ACTTE|nr:transmembrane protein 199-like [Actinia tenebrosa]
MVVEVILTRQIEQAIKQARKIDEIPEDLIERLSHYGEDEDNDRDKKIQRVIEFKLVREVWLYLKKNQTKSDKTSRIYLHELLEGSELYVEPPKPPEKSPELVARLKRLKAEQERLQYDKMVSNLGPKWADTTESLATEVKSTSKQLSSVVNFLCTVGATFVFGFVASQYAFPNLALRVIIGIVLACFVAVAEIYFMARTEI